MGGKKYFIAEFERKSTQKPLHRGGFFSFIEDFNRAPGADGQRIVVRPKSY